jgi:membrane-bound lytic murein transglycosylase F
MLLTSDSLIDYTIADSNEFSVTRRYYPKLNVGFDLGQEQPLAWALKKTKDNSLQKAVNKFFAKAENDGSLTLLREKYFGHVKGITPVDSHTFLKHVRERLPKFESLFKQAAVEYEQDWRFLAAVSYQESLWNSEAVSPTGVKGLMMLTRDAAKQLKIKNRDDPHKSVLGGTEYFLSMHDKIPERIQEPDRTWLALAAYNIGFGHLEDARILTQNAGEDPDLWMNVRKYLPLLSNKKWYKYTRHGYARGKEPVVYVQNIRNYFDLLVWLENKGELYELYVQI